MYLYSLEATNHTGVCTTTTNVYSHFPQLMQGMASGFPQQFPPPSTVMSIIRLQSTLSYPSQPPHTMSSLAFLVILYHLNRLLFTKSDINSIPILSISSSLNTVSLSNMPHILHSVLSSLLFSSTVITHVSLPYTIAHSSHRPHTPSPSALATPPSLSGSQRAI